VRTAAAIVQANIWLPEEKATMDPRYPIGKFEMPAQVTPARRQQAIDEIAAAPAKMRAAAKSLSDSQLDTPYREGGWTVRQGVHHVSDVGIEVAVRNVMHDLPHRPAAFAVRRVKLRVAQTLGRGAHFGRRGGNLVDCLLTPSRRDLRRHFKFSNRVARIHRGFLLGQPDICLDYSGGRSHRSMPFMLKASPIWLPAFRIAGKGMLQYRTALYPAAVALNLMHGERSNVQRRHHRQRLRRSNCCNLRCSREPEAACSVRA